MIRHGEFCLLALAVAACGGARAPETVVRSEPATVRVGTTTGSEVTLAATQTVESTPLVVAVPLERAWAALPAVYAAIDVEPRTVVTAEHLVGNTGARVRKQLGGVRMAEYLDCGIRQGEHNADSYLVNLSLQTRLVALDSARTVVHTVATARATPVGLSTDPVHCVSTGRLERRIADLVAERSRG